MLFSIMQKKKRAENFLFGSASFFTNFINYVSLIIDKKKKSLKTIN